MNPGLVLENIKTKLISDNYLNIVQEIEDRVRSGSTGSEIWASVGHYLKHLNEVNVGAYNLVKIEVSELEKYLKSIGLTIS